MALKIWLPLNGNLDNTGTRRPAIAPVGTPTINNNGKIGKCYTFSGSNGISVAEQILPSQAPEWSFACWFKLANTTSTAAGTLFSERTGGNYNGYTIFLYPNNSKMLIDDGVRWTVTPMTFSANVWYHLVITRSSAGKKLYVNGELKSSTTTVGSTSAVNANGCLIGLAQSGTSLTAGNQGFIGDLNDVRIYDHCLSVLEVKEISQGLILHYKLNGQSGGVGENLLLGSKSFNRWVNQSPSNILINDGIATWHDITSASWKSITYYNYGTWADLVNKEITFSVDIRTDDINNFPTSGTNIQLTCAVFNGTSRIAYRAFKGIVQTDVSSSWKRISGTCLLNTTNFSQGTIESTYTVGAQIFNNTTASFQVKNPKIEIGDFATAYSPAPEEIGKNLTKMVDSSGYGNNGIIFNSPISVKDSSSRYNICTQFNGSNTYINAGTNAKVKDEITITWWGYMDTWSSYGRAISCTEGGGWNFEPSNGKLNLAMGTGATSNTYKSCTSNTTLASLSSGWHFFAGTYDGLVSNLYIDGVLDKTLSCYTTKTPIYYHPTNSIIVGAEAGSGSTAATPYFNGKLSDIRIYATALSAADILSLYNTPANVDKLGGVHGFEFAEKETTNLSDFSPSTDWVTDGEITRTVEVTDFGPALKLTTSAANKRIYKNVTNVWNANQAYTVSFYAKASVNGITCNMSRSLADFSENFTLTTEWKKYTGTIKCTSTNSGGTLSFRIVPASGIVYIKNIKLELANPNLIKINKNGIFNENNIDELDFANVAKFMKNSNNIIGFKFIEK